jgi:hypothetical protein
LVVQRRGIVRAGVFLNPQVDALPGHAEDARDVGGGASTVEFENGKGTPEEMSVRGLFELATQAGALPGQGPRI